MSPLEPPVDAIAYFPYSPAARIYMATLTSGLNKPMGTEAPHSSPSFSP